MRMMRFSALYLLSMRERRALSIKFSADVTLLQARNGFGKSAVTKSLYEAFGAVPHKIDASWRSANVTILVEFSIGDLSYKVLKAGGRYVVYDGNDNPLIDTGSVTSELSPFFADLFNFRLLMSDRSGDTVVPPPAYIFAPFYVDQDRSWSAPWQSFDKMYLPNSARSLSEYHTGIRPNIYYEAKARRDRCQVALDDVEEQRRSLSKAIAEIRDIGAGLALNFSLEDFNEEVGALISRSAELSRLQTTYRDRLSELENERALWLDQQDILRRSMREMRETVQLAAEQPETVECPTCGQHYENSVAEQFGIIANFDDLFDAFQAGRERIVHVEEHLRKQRSSLTVVEAKLREVHQILSHSREDTTLDDVIVARGRVETADALRRRLAAIDEALGVALTELKRADADLKRITDPKRTERINAYFSQKAFQFSTALDVRTSTSPKGVSATGLARGSEGPRGLIGYYYAVLHTAQEFGSSVYCPIVIDAPNQQGQDAQHLPAILNFLAEHRPTGAQVIIASEEAFELGKSGADVIAVGVRRNQVLREAEYEEVAEHMRPYLGQLL